MPPVASLVAGDLIEAARDEHPTYDARRHPNRILRRALSRYQRQLVPKVIRINASAMTEVLEQAFPLPDFEAGITLPDYTYPAAVEAEMTPEPSGARNRRFQVELVAWEARFRFHMAAYIRNNQLYLTGTARDWVGFETLRFYYVPQVEDLAAQTDTLVLPNAAEPCLVAYLAYFMAKRPRTDDPKDKPDVALFRGEWQAFEEAFLDEVGGHTQAQVSVVNERF